MDNLDVVIDKARDLRDFLVSDFSDWEYGNHIVTQLDDFVETILYLKKRVVHIDEDGRAYTNMDAYPNERIYVTEIVHPVVPNKQPSTD